MLVCNKCGKEISQGLVCGACCTAIMAEHANKPFTARDFVQFTRSAGANASVVAKKIAIYVNTKLGSKMKSLLLAVLLGITVACGHQLPPNAPEVAQPQAQQPPTASEHPKPVRVLQTDFTGDMKALFEGSDKGIQSTQMKANDSRFILIDLGYFFTIERVEFENKTTNDYRLGKVTLYTAPTPAGPWTKGFTFDEATATGSNGVYSEYVNATFRYALVSMEYENDGKDVFYISEMEFYVPKEN